MAVGNIGEKTEAKSTWKTREQNGALLCASLDIHASRRGWRGAGRLIPADSKIITIESRFTIRALWLPSSENFFPTVLLVNDNTIVSSGATVQEYEQHLKGYEQQADEMRNKFNVNVLMVYHQGYVM